MIDVIVDGDMLLYRAGFATEKTHMRFNWNDGTVEQFPDQTLTQVRKTLKERGLTRADGRLEKVRTVEPLSHALHLISKMVSTIASECGSTIDKTLVIVGGDAPCFRYKVAVTFPYKGTRTAPKPQHLEPMKQYLLNHFGAQKAPDGLESDDYVGILSQIHTNAIVVAVDKDLKQLPCRNYNPLTKVFTDITDPGCVELYDNRKKIRGYGETWLWAQCLLGDSSDNIPGIPGYGPVKTFNALGDAKCARTKTVEIYYHYFKNFDRLLEVAELLYIHRKENDPFIKEFKVWLQNWLSQRKS